MAAKKTETKTKLRRIMDATVVNVIDETTVKVKVERKFPHPKYGKIIKEHKTYLANKAAKSELNKGDSVQIGEIKPISRRKTWEILTKTEKK